MSIKVICEKCGKPLQASDESAGKRAKCPSCGASVLISAAPSAVSLPVAEVVREKKVLPIAVPLSQSAPAAALPLPPAAALLPTAALTVSEVQQHRPAAQRALLPWLVAGAAAVLFIVALAIALVGFISARNARQELAAAQEKAGAAAATTDRLGAQLDEAVGKINADTSTIDQQNQRIAALDREVEQLRPAARQTPAEPQADPVGMPPTPESSQQPPAKPNKDTTDMPENDAPEKAELAREPEILDIRQARDALTPSRFATVVLRPFAPAEGVTKYALVYEYPAADAARGDLRKSTLDFESESKLVDQASGATFVSGEKHFEQSVPTEVPLSFPPDVSATGSIRVRAQLWAQSGGKWSPATKVLSRNIKPGEPDAPGKENAAPENDAPPGAKSGAPPAPAGGEGRPAVTGTPTEPLSDPFDLTGYRGQKGKILYFEVTGADSGSVYGSGIYTGDSHLATAAVHAGVLKVGETGVLKVTLLGPQKKFRASTQNGITSNSWEAWDTSYRVEAVAARREE